MTINEMMVSEGVVTPVVPVALPEGPEAPDAPSGGLGLNLGFLLAKTGEGSIESYLPHPLNPNQSKGIAQMLRGVTGMFGDTDYAIADILFGGMAYMREKGAAAREATNSIS